MDINLDNFDLDQLKDLQKKVAKKIENFEQRKRDEALAAAVKGANLLGSLNIWKQENHWMIF